MSGRKPTLNLELINRSKTRMPKAFLESWVLEMAKLGAKTLPTKAYDGKSLVVVFVDDSEMKALNKAYRGKNYATDVLSFEGMEPDSLGELVIAPEVIKKQATEHGLTTREELGYMVLHGFLHLLGFDHEKSEREAKKMFSLQDGLFDLLLTK